MSQRLPSLLATLALAALPVAISGCKSSTVQMGQFQTAGLRIDVLKVEQSSRKQRIDLRLRIWNDHNQQIVFGLADVRLIYKGREVTARPYRQKDGVTDVQAASNREFRWYFEIGDVLTEGTYDVEIRELMRGGLPLGDTAAFKIILGR